jgi:FlaA1/EpsC-like NDP-sugar epimerase
MLLSDVVLLSVCYVSAYLFRYEGVISAQSASLIQETIVPLLVCKITSFFFLDVYRGMWRYTGIMDLLNIIKGSLAGSLFLVLYLSMVYHFSGVSRGIILADFVFTIVAIGGLRLLIRLYYQKGPDFMDEIIFWRRYKNDGKRVLVIGTGPLAEQLFRELQGDSRQTFRTIGFIDEGSVNQGMKIHGVPILGSLEDIHRILSYYRIDDIFIANPEIGAGKIKTLVETCAGLGVRVKVIPSLLERMNGSVAHHLRDIRIEDLLEREPVKLDMHEVSRDLKGKDVLITGAGGSIGSELARQIFKFRPGNLILLDNAETPLYNIDMELKGLPAETNVIPCIGNIKNSKKIDQIFKKYHPHIVFHAAAYKHVPLMELTPLDAVNTNILGTFRLASAACKYHVEKFVMISTDKAVRPTSVMGATKRVAEMIVKAMSGNGTRFVAVRFGNVLGSNGSVVPLFEKQIAVGGPVTVTHPEVTRYFMTIPEAAMLVLQASAIGKGGELFLLDMGEPVRIVDLAKNMIRLAGLVPDRDIKIEYIGLRPGEKLYEELLIAGENVVNTAYNKIKICKNFNSIHEEKLFEAVERFRLLVESSYDHEAAVRILRSLVPAYKEHIEQRGSLMPRHEAVIAYHEETISSQNM